MEMAVDKEASIAHQEGSAPGIITKLSNWLTFLLKLLGNT